jgi:hypothetical protein
VLRLAAVIGLVDVLMAWPLKRAWDEKSEKATAVASTSSTEAAQRQAEEGRKSTTWKWCLLHPSSTKSWPGLSDE